MVLEEYVPTSNLQCLRRHLQTMRDVPPIKSILWRIKNKT